MGSATDSSLRDSDVAIAATKSVASGGPSKNLATNSVIRGMVRSARGFC